MDHIVAVRTGMFSSYEEALRRFQSAGVRYAEVGVTRETDFGALQRLADGAGVTLSTTATRVKLCDPENVEAFRKVIEGTASMGTRKVFVSIHMAEGVERNTAILELRELAEKAGKLGVTLCMETHPPFALNALEAIRTMDEVGHPYLRMNFDTANIYYYNEGADTCRELVQVVDRVASVHLKETDGKLKSNYFPVLGQGIVDFPGVFRILDVKGFKGPYTLEIEGAVVKGKDDEARAEFLAGCLAYLRAIGAAAG